MGVTTTIYSLCSLVIKTIAEQNTLTYTTVQDQEVRSSQILAN